MSARTATTSRRALAMAAVLAATASGLAAFPQAATAAESDVTLTPNPAYAGAPFKGWGSSLVWMANATGSYPAELRDELIDKVFGDEGLNLNIARYNIGGGNATDVPDYLRPGGAVPGWWNPDAPLTDDDGAITSNFADRDRFRAAWTGENASDYDFSADAAQLAWVSAIKDQVDTWEAFSNSPPYFMTESGFVSGGTDPGPTRSAATPRHVRDVPQDRRRARRRHPGHLVRHDRPAERAEHQLLGHHDRWRRLAHEREQAGGCPRRPRAAGRRDQGARR